MGRSEQEMIMPAILSNSQALSPFKGFSSSNQAARKASVISEIREKSPQKQPDSDCREGPIKIFMNKQRESSNIRTS